MCMCIVGVESQGAISFLISLKASGLVGAKGMMLDTVAWLLGSIISAISPIAASFTFEPLGTTR